MSLPVLSPVPVEVGRAPGPDVADPPLVAAAGRTAWRVLGAAVAIQAVCLGTVASHGVTMGYLPAEVGLSRGSVWVLFSLAALVQFGLGPVVARVADRLGPTDLGRATAALYVTSLLAAAVLSSPLLAVVVCALGTGAAGACALTPLMATAAGWFEERRVVAVAAMVVGNGVAAFLAAPLTSALVGSVGVRAAWGIFGVVGAAVVLVAAPRLERPTASASPEVAEWSPAPFVFADAAFRRYYAATVLATTGALLPLALLVPAAVGAGRGPSSAALVLGLAHVSGIVGRIAVTFRVVEGSVAVRLRRTQLLLAVTVGLWAVVGPDGAALPAFAVAYGAVFGAFAVLSPALVVSAYRDRIGHRMGVIYTAPGIGGLIGPLIATQLAGAPGSVTATAVFGGTVLALSALVLPTLDVEPALVP